MLTVMDDKRLEIVARNRGIRAKEGESTGKLLTAFLGNAEEGVIGTLIVEAVILLSASKQSDGGKILRSAAPAYKVASMLRRLDTGRTFEAVIPRRRRLGRPSWTQARHQCGCHR